MTDFQPTPQTPDQVDEGLRDAFRQAKKDGVMDATPYLKQMTYKSDIEKTEAEIKVLQKKLDLLKEIETHKAQPRMEYQQSGTVDKVEYNGHTYLRIDYDNDSWFGGVWWKQIERHKSPMNIVTDDETRNILEGLWFNQVKKGVIDEPEHYDEVVDRLIEQHQAQKLWNILKDKWGFSKDECSDIVDAVAEWLPKPQSAEGSQNVNTELLVDGFNHCLEKIKGMLR